MMEFSTDDKKYTREFDSRLSFRRSHGRCRFCGEHDCMLEAETDWGVIVIIKCMWDKLDRIEDSLNIKARTTPIDLSGRELFDILEAPFVKRRKKRTSPCRELIKKARAIKSPPEVKSNVN